MKRYVGSRLLKGCVVSVVDDLGRVRDLEPQLHVRNHSPTGFEWGYAGSGPAQLAIAICVDALKGDVARAERAYQGFKFVVVQHLEEERWSLTEEEVLEKIAAIEEALAEIVARPAGVDPF